MEADRIRQRADGAISKLDALRWHLRLWGSNAITLERAKAVIESQRDEILALNAYLDSIEPTASPSQAALGTEDAPAGPSGNP
jgi:hypothetical protein